MRFGDFGEDGGKAKGNEKALLSLEYNTVSISCKPNLDVYAQLIT